MERYFFISLIVVGIFMLTSCAGPLLSEMQSARTVEAGKLEATPIFQLNESQRQFGLQLRTGINGNLDLSTKFEYGHYDGRSEVYDYSLGSVGVKYGFIKNLLAFNLPIGFYQNADLVAYGLSPSVIGTIPIIKNKFELSLIPKYSIGLIRDNGSNEYFDLFTAQANLAISSNLNKWAFRTEGSYMGNDKFYFGLGFSYTINLTGYKSRN